MCRRSRTVRMCARESCCALIFACFFTLVEISTDNFAFPNECVCSGSSDQWGCCCCATKNNRSLLMVGEDVRKKSLQSQVRKNITHSRWELAERETTRRYIHFRYMMSDRDDRRDERKEIDDALNLRINRSLARTKSRKWPNAFHLRDFFFTSTEQTISWPFDRLSSSRHHLSR